MRQAQDGDHPCPGPEEPAQIDSLKTAECEKQELEQHRALLHSIVQAQSEFIAGAEAEGVFQQLLDALVQATSSEFGFIGEVLYGPGGEPYEKICAVASAGRNGEMPRSQEWTSLVGAEFRNLKTLYGAVLTTGNIVCTNDPATDPRRGGVPPGHPPLRAFLGLPARHGDKLVGMVGLANRPGGYDDKIISFVQPLVSVCATTIEALRASSENARTQLTLRESEERFRALVENAPDAIFVQTQKRFAYLNPAAVRLFGATSDAQLLGQPVMERFHPDFREAVEERIRLLNEVRKPVPRLEEKYLKLDETPVDVEVSAVPISYENHNGALVYVRDITERKQAEDALRLDITERERAEQEAREANASFSALIEAAPLGIVTLDREFKVRLWNRAAEAMFGWSAEEVLGGPLPIVPAEHREEAQRLIEREFAGETLSTVELRRQHKNGKPIDVEVSTALMRDASETICGLMGIFNDVTARKQAEEKLRETQERFEFVATATNDVIFDHDLRTNRVWWNEAIRLLVGGPVDQVTDVSWWEDRVHPEDRPRIVPEVTAHDLFSAEYRLRRDDGSYAYVYDRAYVIRNGAGERVRIVGAMVDLTEARRAQEGLRRSELKYRALFENANVAILIFEPENEKILEANPAASKLYGLPRSQLVGTSLKKLSKDVARGERAIAELLRTGSRYTFETVQFDRNGQRIDLLVSAAVIEYEGKAAILSINRDITERKQAERAIRKLSGELMRVQDEERRHLARELHDTTAQNLSLLKMNLSLLPQQEILGESVALADRCLQEVRTVSYLLHPPLLDELGLAEALTSYIEGFTKRTGINVRLHLPSRVPRLPQELETSLFRIAQESLMNVHRHSGSKTARVGIAFSRSQLVLVVRDNGRGMERAVLQKALHEPSKLGVGIAGMHERARQFGGRLEVTSNAHGTLVKAVLPVGEDTV